MQVGDARWWVYTAIASRWDELEELLAAACRRDTSFENAMGQVVDGRVCLPDIRRTKNKDGGYADKKTWHTLTSGCYVPKGVRPHFFLKGTHWKKLLWQMTMFHGYTRVNRVKTGAFVFLPPRVCRRCPNFIACSLEEGL